MIELRGTFQAWLQQQKDQVVNLDSYSPKPLQCQKIPICYDDEDDEESSTPLRDIIIFEIPSCIAITPVLSTKETKDSLIIGDEHLDTIPEKESDEFIKSSVENLVPNPTIAITFNLPSVEPDDSLRMGDEHLDTISATESDEFIKSSVENLVSNLSESEDLSDSECDMPACEDFATFSNLLFDDDDDFFSSDDESFSDEDISKEIYSNPLFDEEIISVKIDLHHFNPESDLIESLLNHDFSIISSSFKIDSLLDEIASELIILKTIPPGIYKINCDPEEEIHLIKKLLYDKSSPLPPEVFISENSDAAIESFSLSHIHVEDIDSHVEEIDLSFTPDDSMPSSIKEDDYDSERDMLIHEELLSNDSLSFPKNESFHFDIPSFPRPPVKPPNDDSRILTVKVMGDIS
nr:hypothetical protein [Tanacetum cinerariifolium]